IDLEALGEIAAQFVQKCVAWMALWHDQMAGQRVLSRAHRPDMQVMHVDDALFRRKKAPNRRGIDLRRDRRHRHADGISEKAPSAPYDDRVDGEADDRIDYEPAGQ